MMNEQFYKQVIESIEDYCVFTTDINGIINTWNSGAERILEYTEEEIIGKHAEIIFTPEDRAQNAPQHEMDNAKNNGRGIDERWHVKKSGERFWGSGLIFPLNDDAGKLIGFTKIMRDLTDKKDQESKEEERKNKILVLETERLKLKEVFDNAPAFISITRGKDHVFDMVNKAYYQLVGHKDLIGKSVFEVFPEVKEQGYIDLLDNVYNTAVPFVGNEMKLQLQRTPGADQEDRFVNFVYQASRDTEGKITGIIALGHDVTEQVEIRNKIEESEERFRTLADNIPNLTWMANADGYIFWYNSRWYEYTGTTPEQMEGWGWQSVHDPECLPGVMERWTASIQTGARFDMVFPIKGSNGIFRPFLTRVIPVKNDKGNIIRWFGTNTDISSQKELERQKDNFLGMASHELKTPVTVIKAFTQVLESTFTKEGNAVAANYLKKMDVQVNKLTGLIESLLDVTRMQTGKLHFTYALFDFNNLVNEVVDHIQPTTIKHNIKMDLSKTENVYGDRDRIGQVITNFITNAIKYSPNADKVFIKTKADEKNMQLSVTDFGLGINKENQKRVFEQFFRVGDNQQNTFPGVGLGLYISSEIIKREGGKIWVESEEGIGSTFYFSIPINNMEKISS